MSASKVLLAAAVVMFCLAAAGVVAPFPLVLAGLACFAAGHIA
jgi:hypothetical protein